MGLGLGLVSVVRVGLVSAATSEEVFIFLARYFLRWATVRRAEVRR